MHRNAAKVTLGGQRASWLGVNFWSRTGGPLMWRNYDSQVIREELRALREHGLTMTRSCFYWPRGARSMPPTPRAPTRCIPARGTPG